MFMIDSLMKDAGREMIEFFKRKVVTVVSTAQLPNQTFTRPSPPIPNPPSGMVEPVNDEQITEIVDRLQLHYPSERISRADLESRVRSFHRQFNTASIRSFVAVFVERLVRRSIEEPSAPRVGVRPGA
jgi:hypothetical protein